jgi:type II secretory pathway component GspD/PulD (secretin)
LALTNVTTSEALSAILETAQAQLIPEGSLIRVVPLAELHRTTEMDNGIFARTYRIDYVDPANIIASLTSLLPDAEKIEAIKDTNYLIVRGNRAVLRKADALIKTIDTTPKQVVVEAKVLEVRAKDAADAGLDVKYQSPNDTNDRAQTKGLAGKATDSGAQGFYAQVISGNVEAYFSALATKTGTNIVASPRITTLSDKPARILIGAKYGYKTTIVTDTSTTQTVEFLEVGTSLTITPHITKDGFIKMKVEPKVSDGQVINDLPQENTTETVNEVMVRDGQTIVIGGLYKDKEIETDIGVPFLMEIPFLGAFFRKTKTETEKNELLIFVTPHILTPETLTDMAKEAADMEERSGQKSRLIH